MNSVHVRTVNNITRWSKKNFREKNEMIDCKPFIRNKELKDCSKISPVKVHTNYQQIID